jgi:hypothetical protein
MGCLFEGERNCGIQQELEIFFKRKDLNDSKFIKIAIFSWIFHAC